MSVRGIHKSLEETYSFILTTAEEINQALIERNYRNNDELQELNKLNEFYKRLLDVFEDGYC